MGKIKSILLGLGVFTSVATGTLYWESRTPDVEIDNDRSYNKARIFQIDFPLNAVMLDRYHSKDTNFKEDELTIGGFTSGETTYTDTSNDFEYDGLVDIIQKKTLRQAIKGQSGIKLYRDENFNDYKEEFLKADRILAEVKEKYREHIEF